MQALELVEAAVRAVVAAQHELAQGPSDFAPRVHIGYTTWRRTAVTDGRCRITFPQVNGMIGAPRTPADPPRYALSRR